MTAPRAAALLGLCAPLALVAACDQIVGVQTGVLVEAGGERHSSQNGDASQDAKSGDAEAKDRSAVDVSIDRNKVDGSVDGTSADASDGAPGPTFCELNGQDATLCEDFDRDAEVAWDALANIDGSTLVRDDKVSVSAPNSLLVESPAVDAGGILAIFLKRTFALTVKQVTVDLDLRVESWAAGSSNYANVVTLEDGASTNHVNLQFQESMLSFFEKGSAGAFEIAHATIKSKEWIHATVTLDLSSTTVSVTVKADVVGGASLINQTVTPNNSFGSSFGFLQIGLPYVNVVTVSDGGGNPWGVHIDNVRLYAQ